MTNLQIDTKVLREKGRDIMQLSVDLNDILVSLYNRIDNMPISTLEWTGNSALEFVRKVDVEKPDYFKMKEMIYNYGKLLVDSADEFDEKISMSRKKLDL